MPSNFTNLFYYRGLKNLIISVWGSDIIYDNPKKQESLRQIFYKRALLSQARVLTATNNFLRHKILEYFPNAREVEIIPFGVDTDKFKLDTRGLKKEKITISFVKHLTPKYGPSFLIKAFSKVAERYPNVELYMVGEGELMQELIKLARDLGVDDKIYFQGHISQIEVVELLKRTDIFVMPSIYETFGVAALEASAMEIPVIATKVGGVQEVVKDGKTGFLVDKEDISKLSNAILKLIKNKKLRKLFGKYGRSFVRENYEWNNNVNKMGKIYLELL